MKEATNREKRRLMVWFGRTAKVLLGLGVILLGFTLYYFGRRAVSQTSLFELETIEYQGAHRFDAEAQSVEQLCGLGRVAGVPRGGSRAEPSLGE